MPEIAPSTNNRMADPASRSVQLLALFKQVMPLVHSLAHKLRWVAFIGALGITWIGIWLYFFKGFSVTITMVVLGIILLPLLVIIRFWWSLEELKSLPSILEQMTGDTVRGVRESVQGLNNGNVKVGMLGSVSSLWSVGLLLRQGKDLLGSYVGLATLVNPFSLLLGVLSLLFVMFLVLVGLVLAVLAV